MVYVRIRERDSAENIARRNRIRTQAASAHEVVGSGATHGHSYISCDVCFLKCSSSTLFIANANGNMSRLSYILASITLYILYLIYRFRYI